MTVYSLRLHEVNEEQSIFSSELKTFTIHNSSGTYSIPNNIIYYHGYINSINESSYVHGTLYHELTFEGVLKLPNVTLYVEAIDRYQPWLLDQSILYNADDVAKYSKSSFPDNILKQTGNKLLFPSFSSIYTKYHSIPQFTPKHNR